MRGGNFMAKKYVIDKGIFIPSIGIILAVTLLIFVFPSQASAVISILFRFLENEMGWCYLLIAVFCLASCLWMAFSKIGNVRLGGENAKKTYGEFSWAAMMFTAGIGVGVAVNAFSDPLSMIQIPVLGTEPLSASSLEMEIGRAHV